MHGDGSEDRPPAGGAAVPRRSRTEAEGVAPQRPTNGERRRREPPSASEAKRGATIEQRLRALGFDERAARTLADHFLNAEARGKKGHGLSRVDWLETLPGIDPSARPRREVHEQEYERWDGNGALGYLTLAAIVETTLMNRPTYARVIVARR